ncbi:hypothetical protein [Agriterribacter sp.]|uniref:hypothetical protein n=1 Tax=Agriterribacter sp. TaxID=2821509 RepID=UPI002BAFDA3F|nr:hypothetical protein [Agriterribacter sp.]HRP56934.1 hypothetical protein [Agriterribacter sp.]
MRQLSAIFLILIFLFNLAGYRLLLQYWEVQENTKMEVRLDQQQYDEKDLVEVKIPINLPYHSNWSDFERYDGEIDIDGVHYKYVKRKIFNDSLVLLCIPDKIKTKINTARDEFFSLVNDLQKDTANTKSSHSSLLFQFSAGDYISQQAEDWSIAAISNIVPHWIIRGASPLLSVSVSSPWQPPDADASAISC